MLIITCVHCTLFLLGLHIFLRAPSVSQVEAQMASCRKLRLTPEVELVHKKYDFKFLKSPLHFHNSILLNLQSFNLLKDFKSNRRQHVYVRPQNMLCFWSPKLWWKRYSTNFWTFWPLIIQPLMTKGKEKQYIVFTMQLYAVLEITNK